MDNLQCYRTERLPAGVIGALYHKDGVVGIYINGANGKVRGVPEFMNTKSLNDEGRIMPTDHLKHVSRVWHPSDTSACFYQVESEDQRDARLGKLSPRAIPKFEDDVLLCRAAQEQD